MDDLILSFLKEEITEAERKALEDWINADPLNKEQFKNIYRIWDAANHTNEDVDGILQKVKYKLNQGPEALIEKEKNLKIHSFIILKWVAIVVISFITGALGYRFMIHGGSDNNSKFVNVINVPLGSKSDIILPDGTQVTLNAGSKLTYTMDYGTSLREVNLTGEGYFKVAPNTKAPFIVKTVKASIKALGTEFNVKAYPEEKTIETVLVKGSVLVSEILTEDEKRAKKLKTVILKPGQKVQIFKEVQELPETNDQGPLNVQENNSVKTIQQPGMVVAKAEAETETSWKDQRWIIKGTDLENLAVLLSRRFNVTIRLQDEDLKKYRFSGTIENETIEEVFAIMQYTIPISYTIDKGKVVWTINRNLEKVYKEAY